MPPDHRRVVLPAGSTVSSADLVPFWHSPVVARESLLFVAEGAREPASAPLLYSPTEIHSLTTADGSRHFVDGVDFVVDRERRRCVLTPGTHVPWVALDDLYPAAVDPQRAFMHTRGNASRFLLWAEGDVFHRQQVAMSYAHAPDGWPAKSPAYAGLTLPRTAERLAAGQPVTICLVGDSISEGYNASGFVGAPPWQPSYGTLVATGLARAFNTHVTLRNLAQAGSASDTGQHSAVEICASEPDVLMVAFGMNDAGYLEADTFGANIHALVAAVRQIRLATEVVLVAPMLPHADWHYPVVERFPAYRDALASLCGPGVVLADVFSVWQEMLTRKRVYDLTGNGINHPNDFGHRVYAQVVLSLLLDAAAWRRLGEGT